MDVNKLYILVETFFGYKAKMLYSDSAEKEVTCILYNSFLFKCNVNGRYGTFGAGLHVNQEIPITDYLGKRCSLNSDETSIKESLQIVDDYCRLRLPDKFLDAYYKAYGIDY